MNSARNTETGECEGRRGGPGPAGRAGTSEVRLEEEDGTKRPPGDDLSVRPAGDELAGPREADGGVITTGWRGPGGRGDRWSTRRSSAKLSVAGRPRRTRVCGGWSS